MMKRKITLASTSPRRNGLLEQIGLEFDVVGSDYKEDMNLKMNPKKMVVRFAEGKAQDVADNKVVGGLVIGVDTIVLCRGRKLGKPGTKENAVKMLRFISGKTIRVYSGICIIDLDEKKKILDYEVSKVKMKKLADKEIEAYVNSGEPLDKAGAFAIQEMGAIFVKKVNGCASNIMGLPIYNLYKNLIKIGTDIFAYEKWNGENGTSE